MTERLDALLQLAAVDRVSTYEELAVWLGVSYNSLRKWPDRGIGPRTALKVLGGLRRRGYDCSLDWVQNGVGMGPGGPLVPSAERSAGLGITARQDERSGVGIDPVTAERELLVDLVGHALMGAVERALERDELEHTRKGHRILGTAFLGLAVELRKSGDMDVHELVDVSHELLKRAQP